MASEIENIQVSNSNDEKKFTVYKNWMIVLIKMSMVT